MSKKSSAANEPAPAIHLIYVGPNIVAERLNRFAVFKGGLPKHLDELFAACPAAKRLCVNVVDLTATLDQISKTGTAYNTWFSQVEAFLGQKGAR
ncbi:hypothetical protein [Anaeroselena agilis]|uniref:Uncharacterized protein n=1 Tax=Anaeroselena agilis TaxID=3063788 RepID=A0ABU3P175_9FIRM|nr:hypothetical protein [Selenomonadales bacterium 4137-cl]